MLIGDISPMPFGIYKGRPMQDVPVSYLHYLWQKRNNAQGQLLAVIDYIERSLDALKEEDPDLIWS